MAAPDDFDIGSYLLRISYDGPSEPSLAALGAIVSAHVAAIPYENIDVLLKRGIRLDVTSLQQKLVHAGRGGYCFEQNALLEAALESLGFAVTRLAGRLVRGGPVSAPEVARTHKLLRVDLPEGPYIVDVGFGNLTPTGPIALCPEQVQATPHEPFRLMPHGTEFVLQSRLGDVWDSLYRFPLEPVPAIDFQMANWFTSTFPSGLFANNLIVARPIAGGRATVYNRRFTIRDCDNRTTRRALDGISDYRDVLVEQFGLELDDNELAAITLAVAPHAVDEEVHRAFV
jgi:N-hydroxyarylamine O-acetyltransferase